MRVLFLATWFPFPLDIGYKIRVYHLLWALGQSHEVTLLSFAFDMAKEHDAGELQQFCRDIQVVALDPFATNRASTLRRFLSPVPLFTRPIPAMRELVRQTLHRQSFDVIIASTEVMAAYALEAPSSIARVLEEHNSLTRWMQDRHGQSSGLWLRGQTWVSAQKARRYEAGLFPKFDMISMVSEQDCQVSRSLVPHLADRIVLIPNGVDCQHNVPGLVQPRDRALVYNGALGYYANYDAMQYFLAEIYSRIKQVVPDVTLAITGSTRGVDLSGLAIDESVALTGYVDDIRRPVGEASVCVVPLREGGGTRLKILEAMALGTPVVTTSKGVEGIEAIDGEHVLLADTSESFARQVTTLLENSELRQRLVRNARSLVETTYDWRFIAGRFVWHVERLVEQAIRP